jgi:hypothetical protein
MADVRTDNGSPERVAYSLWDSQRGYLSTMGGDQAMLERSMKLFVACRKAAFGASYDLSDLAS